MTTRFCTTSPLILRSSARKKKRSMHSNGPSKPALQAETGSSTIPSGSASAVIRDLKQSSPGSRHHDAAFSNAVVISAPATSHRESVITVRESIPTEGLDRDDWNPANRD